MKLIRVEVKYNKFIPIPGANSPSYFATADIYDTFIKDDGNKIYILNNKLISKDEGNNHYLKVKKSYSKTPEYLDFTTEYEMTNEDFIKEIEEKIDMYTEYIDDYKQQKIAKAKNDAFYSIINSIRG